MQLKITKILGCFLWQISFKFIANSQLTSLAHHAVQLCNVAVITALPIDYTLLLTPRIPNISPVVHMMPPENDGDFCYFYATILVPCAMVPLRWCHMWCHPLLLEVLLDMVPLRWCLIPRLLLLLILKCTFFNIFCSALFNPF